MKLDIRTEKGENLRRKSSANLVGLVPNIKRRFMILVTCSLTSLRPENSQVSNV